MPPTSTPIDFMHSISIRAPSDALGREDCERRRGEDFRPEPDIGLVGILRDVMTSAPDTGNEHHPRRNMRSQNHAIVPRPARHAARAGAAGQRRLLEAGDEFRGPSPSGATLPSAPPLAATPFFPSAEATSARIEDVRRSRLISLGSRYSRTNSARRERRWPRRAPPGRRRCSRPCLARLRGLAPRGPAGRSRTARPPHPRASSSAWFPHDRRARRKLTRMRRIPTMPSTMPISCGSVPEWVPARYAPPDRRYVGPDRSAF